MTALVVIGLVIAIVFVLGRLYVDVSDLLDIVDEQEGSRGRSREAS